MSEKIYENSVYYEIAFSFINPKKQVDLFEKFIKKYSKIKVRRFLDIGCGPSLQLRELAKRGYEAVGLDLSSQMLKYLKQKAKEEGIKIETVKSDMTNFSLRKKTDFAFIMMGSFEFKNNQELLRHLDSVGRSLKKGGLYLIENLKLDWPKIFKPQTWVMKKDGIKIKTTYKLELKNPIPQTCKENIIMEVNDNGNKLRFFEKGIIKNIFPQEFLELIKINNKFEFIGWFEREKMNPLLEANNNNIVILRRK